MGYGLINENMLVFPSELCFHCKLILWHSIDVWCHGIFCENVFYFACSNIMARESDMGFTCTHRGNQTQAFSEKSKHFNL